MDKQPVEQQRKKQNQSKFLVYNILLFVNVEVIDYVSAILSDRIGSGKSLSLSYSRVWPCSLTMKTEN